MALRDPKLALAILKLYEAARSVQGSDQPAPDEDFTLYTSALKKLLAEDSDHDI